MEHSQSLDDLIARKAVEFAGQMRQAAAMADKEEEIRIGAERQLAFIEKEAGVKLEGKHEFTVASGRVDSVYQRVIIEYKNPSSPSDRIGSKPDSPGTKKVVDQIKKRFYDMRTQHGQPLNSLFGVGLDGNHFVFIRFRDEKWQVQDPVEVNKHSAERFLWALFNMGRKGKPFSPEYLAGDFGSEAKLAHDGIHTLYEAIAAATHPKAQTFFNQWKILFGEVCGYDVDNPSEKVKKLAEFYGVELKGLKPAELLFAVHSYYAIFMKLLASEIVAFFHKLPTPLQKMMQAGTSAKLRREMEDLEAGSIFRHLNITNFLEGDLFAWYVPVWAEPIEKLVRAMVAKLDDYNPGTLSEDPAGSRDLLKKLYQQLFPKSVRHDLGEYYTPDWLAEHVLNELGYAGNPDKRILDPACGSGTFLVVAINRIRAWYDQNREKCAFGNDDLCRKILANVIGFDLNPLAVMAARTNYLIAIRDLVGHVDKVEIPIYLCDSILTPSTYGGLFAGTTRGAKELRTAAATFVIPTEIATNRDDVAKYAEQLEHCVRNGYSPTEFMQRCQDEGLRVTAANLHADLYTELVRLDRANKNGVWARIIKNAFAPLFVGTVDYVAGNPPWVFWNNLPDDYREQVRRLMTDTYRIAAGRQSTMARLGAAGKDISMLFVYVGADSFLKPDGRLGFVITQTLFQTGAGDEFRRFTLPGGIPLCVLKVEDWVAVHPFQKSAANKTAILFLARGRQTTYPVEYPVYTVRKDFDRDDATLDEVKLKVAVSPMRATPSRADRPGSFWQVGSGAEQASSGESANSEAWRARKGIDTNLESVFRVSCGQGPRPGTVLIHNITERAKKVVAERTAAIESDLVVPFVSGMSLHNRWGFDVSAYYVLPHTAETGMRPVPEAEMRRRYPKTYEYLRTFMDDLVGRPLHQRWGKSFPFYSVYNIGPYTFAPYRVAWKASTKKFGVVVLSIVDDPLLGERIVVGNKSVITISFDDAASAHFVAGLLNSKVARSRVSSAVTSWVHKDILNVLPPIPRFDRRNEDHRIISRLSQEAHAAHSRENEKALGEIEAKLDAAVGGLWHVTE